MIVNTEPIGKLPNTQSNPSPRRPPTAAEVLARQKADAERQRGGNGTAVATTTASTAVAVPDKRTATAQYLDEIAPASIVGRLIKFSKEGQFVTSDDGEPVSDVAEFVAEHQRQPGQEQHLALGPGRIDGRCQRLVGGLEIR